ncbi:MAG: prolipoprotein diacylglyceryl transferase [Anaerolineales bacterium]|nr:prolipoprotein diacylglyceryl transferase [Anaerolineales bacterium]MCX7756312.1 prolipoprotein diacylglyceryl transferase [Anaerolineales bacterium]MDW8278530.1 prolipoprotein diacylglyceryl transferase [Anaerolineales bacterium]
MSFEFEGIHFFLFGFEFVLYYYGLIIMSGALAGGWLATRQAAWRGHDPEIVWDLLIWLVIGGVIGARLWHVFTPSPSLVAQGIDTMYYLTHPFDLINLRKGGLGLPGGVIGGAVALYLFARRHRLSFAEWTDIAAPSLALGQAIGRWGNYFNQELYGAPTNLPWKLYIDPQHRLPGFAQVEYYHPLFLYESLWNLGNLFLLLWLGRRFADRLKPGDVFLAYLVVYPLGRFLLEFLRLDSAQIAGVNANQTLMLLVMIGAAAALLWRHPLVMRKPKTND